MKWFLMPIIVIPLVSCSPAIPNFGSYRIFEHAPSYAFRDNKMIDAPELDNFRDGDVIITVGFGKKRDETYILYVNAFTKLTGKSIYFDKVLVTSSDFNLDAKIEQSYTLEKMDSGLFYHQVRVLEDIDVDSISEETAFFDVKVVYNLGHGDKEMDFHVPATYYQAPIR